MASGAGTDVLVHDIQSFMRWSVESLKAYLRKYGLSTSGVKQDLAARAFAAWEMKLKPVKSDKEISLSKSQDYMNCLQVGSERLPDPFLLSDGWLSEKEAMKMWPPIMYIDIANYLGVGSGLDKRLLQDYKEGKAYSYFQAEWMKDIEYHRVSDKSVYGYLRADCCPSMNVHNPPHRVWVAADKKTGEVVSAYCTCFAGLGRTCNHVAALLFRIEHAWRLGYTDASCTSVECQWKKPASTPELLKCRKVRDISWTKPKSTKIDRDIVNRNAQERIEFNPQRQGLAADITSLMVKLRSAAPNAVIHKVWQAKQPTQENNDCLTDLPQSVHEVAEEANSADELLSMLPPIQPEVVGFIERETIGQSENSKWFDQRKGRVTASDFHRIHTRMRTVKKNGGADCTNLLAYILRYKQAPADLKNFKHGRSMEKPAKKEFLRVFKADGHKNVKLHEVGLYVLDSHPYIGASPDAIVECSCHGLSCVEVKCPLTAASAKPSPQNTSYLVEDSGKIQLAKDCAYMSQIQGQMGVTHIGCCHFFVFSMHGHCLIKVPFREETWKDILDNLKYFFVNYMAPELVTRSLHHQYALTQAAHSSSASCAQSSAPSTASSPPPASCAQSSAPSTASSPPPASCAQSSAPSTASSPPPASCAQSSAPSTASSPPPASCAQSSAPSTASSPPPASCAQSSAPSTASSPPPASCDQASAPSTASSPPPASCAQSSAPSTASSPPPASCAQSSAPSACVTRKRSKPSRKRSSRKRRKPIYICPVCSTECEDVCVKESDFSICCDGCDIWFHWHCVGISMDVPGGWECVNCVAK